MNRELKFRIWNGLEMVYDVTVGKFGVFYVNPSNNGLDEKDSASLTPFTTKYSDTTPVMQFTGLKDKNGKDIWEGDFVTFSVRGDMKQGYEEKHYQRGEVKIGVGLSVAYGTWIYHWCYDVVVIGNVYENPDLLK